VALRVALRVVCARGQVMHCFRFSLRLQTPHIQLLLLLLSPPPYT
jgi:hypothetical protein